MNTPDVEAFNNRRAPGAPGVPPLGFGMCAICDDRWQGARICHCATCHLTFTAVGGFDAHRSRGHCLTTEQLRDKGFQPNGAGHWRIPAPAGTFTGRNTRA